MRRSHRRSTSRDNYKNSRNKFIFSQLISLFLLLLLTYIVSLTLYSNPLSQFLPGHDSSMFQYFGYAMDNGRTMYTEIFDHKGPMIFVINYVGVLLSTQNIHGIYFLEFLSLFVYFLFSYKTIHLWLNKTLSFILTIPQGIILMYYLESGNLTEEYALPFIAISLYIFAKYFIDSERVGWFEIVFLGFASAVTFSLRANMVVVWLAFCLVIFLKTMIEKDYKTLLNYAILFSAGLLLFFIPMGAYLYSKGALGEAIFQSLTFNFMYLDTAGDSSEAIMRLSIMLIIHFIPFVFAAFLIYVASKWKTADKNTRYLYLSVVLFSVGSYLASTLSGRAYAHYLMAMVPIVTIPSALLVKEYAEGKSKSLMAMGTLIAIGIIYYPHIDKQYEKIYVINTPVENVDLAEMEQSEEEIEEKRIIEMNHRVLDNDYRKQRKLEVSEVIIENTVASDTIYAHRLAGNPYLLSDRLSSVKYFNLPAVDINENQLIGEDFLSEFTQSDTALVIVSDYFYNSTKTGIEAAFFDYLEENYELIYDQNLHYIFKLKK